MIQKYIRKLFPVEAIQYKCNLNEQEIADFVGTTLCTRIVNQPYYEDNKLVVKLIELSIVTISGEIKINDTDYVIKDVNGEFSSCPENIFNAIYQNMNIDIDTNTNKVIKNE